MLILKMSEEQSAQEVQEVTKEVTKEVIKNPKRVSAGKRGAEAKKMKAALKRKELEEIKEENQRLKNKVNDEPKGSITKDEHPEVPREVPEVKIYKNYLPLCVTIGVVGLGLGFYWMKPREIIKTVPAKKEKVKEVDPFEF